MDEYNKIEAIAEKNLREAAIQYVNCYLPFKIAFADKLKDGIYTPPTDCKKRMAEFDFKKRHYIIYIEK